MNEGNDVIAYVEKQRKFSVDSEKNESLYFYCNNCRSKTSHKTIVHAHRISDDPSCDEVFLVEDYRIVECSGCHGVRFVENSIFSEDDDFYNQVDSNELHCRIYPISEEGALSESRLSELEFVLPTRVKRIYEETLAAIKNKMFVLAGIGLRAVLDTVCRDKGIGKKGDKLADRLDIMLKQQLITPVQKANLDAIRDLGNDSAHEGKSLKAYEVSTALVVVEHILDDVYRLPAIKKEFDDNKEEISFVDEVFGPKTEEK